MKLTTTAIINRTVRVFDLTEHTAPVPALRANLIHGGYDGTIWTGTAPQEGQRKARLGLFYRRTSGQFDLIHLA